MTRITRGIALAAGLFGAGMAVHRAGWAQAAQDQPEEIVVYKSPT